MKLYYLNPAMFKSPVWEESDATRIAWITLLLDCNEDGVCETVKCIVDLSEVANIELGRSEMALARLEKLKLIAHSAVGIRIIDLKKHRRSPTRRKLK